MTLIDKNSTSQVAMDNVEFERAIVASLAAIIEKRGLKHKPVAMAAWPYKKAAWRQWQNMRNNDIPLRLTFRDAFNMAQHLDVPLSSLCAMAESQILDEELKQ